MRYKYRIYFSILPFINTLFFGALYPTALVVQKRHIHDIVYITQTSAYLDKPQAVQMQQYTVTRTCVKASSLGKKLVLPQKVVYTDLTYIP